MAEFGLRRVGTDTPQVATSTETGAPTTADLEPANAYWERAQQTQAQAHQELINQQQARLALKRAEVQQQQINSQQNTSPVADIFNGAAQVLGVIQETRTIRAQQEAVMAQQEAERNQQRVDAEREAAREQFLEDSSRTSTDLLANLQGQLLEADQGVQRDIDSRGYITSYSDAVEYIQKHKDALSPEDYDSLVEWAGQAYEGRNQNQQDHLYQQTREAQTQAAEQVMARQTPALAALSSKIANALSPAESQRYVSNADAILQDIQAQLLQAQVPPSVALSTINQAYDSLMANVGTNAEAREQLVQSQRRYQIYGERIADVEDSFARGDIDGVTRNRMLVPLKLGATGELDFGMLSSLDAMESEVKRLQMFEEMAELSTPEAQAVSGALQGQILIQMNYNGGTAPPQYGEEERRRLERTYTQATKYNEVLQSTGQEVQELANERLTIQGDMQAMITDIGRLQGALEKFQAGDVEALASLGYTSTTEAQAELDSILGEYTSNTQALEGIDQTVAQLRLQESQARDNLALMGLPHGLDYRAHMEYMQSDEYMAQAEAAASQLAEHRRQGQDFSSGNRTFNSAPVPLARAAGVQGSNQEDWEGIPVPFSADATIIVTSGQGMRNGKSHPGIDFGVPGNVEGTPILTPRSGRVTRNFWDDGGGGWVVSVEHADGTESSYLHLQEQSYLRVGDTVSQGQQVGAMGNTGRSTGTHLDLRVKSRAGGSYDVDVTDWLRASVTEAHPESGYTIPSMGLPPAEGELWQTPAAQYQAPPEGAFMFANGDYLFNGQYYYNEEFYLQDRQTFRPVQETFSSTEDLSLVANNAVPVEGVYASATRESYNVTNNNPEHNYGYAFFDRNPHAARKLAQVSNNLQIPAQWLADIMYFETGGSFNPAQDEIGGSGAVGLIQFYPGGGLAQVARDMGVSESVARSRLKGMTFVEQMDWVERYLSGFYAGDTQFVGRYDRIERLLASIFQGQGTAFNNDIVDLLGIGDGNITLGRYMQKLGTSVGRRYYTVQDQVDGVRVHEDNHPDCPTCRAMRDSVSPILPHVAPAPGHGAQPDQNSRDLDPMMLLRQSMGWIGGTP